MNTLSSDSHNGADDPVLSVVIPTHNRPEYLHRAIESALMSEVDDRVEVIVVPNGSDTGWSRIAEQFSTDKRVKWFPLPSPGVSAARNYGLGHARGTLVRFLDDDDYLYPAACQKQCQALLARGADVCSGALELVDDSGRRIKIWVQPDTDDFCVATLAPGRRTQQGCHLYRRSILGGLRWNEKRSLGEDTEWMIALAATREVSWIRIDECVSAWVQHRKPRLYKGRDPGGQMLKDAAGMLLEAASSLDAAGRLCDLRRDAVADGLWSLFQKGFKYAPNYWKGIAKISNSFAANRRPPSQIYRFRLVRGCDPVRVEALLFPIRWAYHPIRRFLDAFGMWGV